MLLLYRPGLLGKTKYEFAKTYCDLKYIKGIQGKYFAVILLEEFLISSRCVCVMYVCVYLVNYHEYLLAAKQLFLTTEEHYLLHALYQEDVKCYSHNLVGIRV